MVQLPQRKSAKFYVWVVPTRPGLAEHTWVTTYDSRAKVYRDIEKVATAGHCFWYCWGNFYEGGNTGGLGKTGRKPARLLGERAGDVALAQCLVAANADSESLQAARGTIFQYSRNGVCHQLANQVLYATRGVGAEPLTVNGARCYMLSAARWGTYGVPKPPWVEKIASCGPDRSRKKQTSQVTEMPAGPDDFENKAREVLGAEDPQLLAQLLALRDKAQRDAMRDARNPRFISAQEINKKNRDLANEAAALLGSDRFEAIFGFSPSEPLDLVDPDIQQLEIQRNRRSKTSSGRSAHGAAGLTLDMRFPRAPTVAVHQTVTLRNIAARLAEDHEMSKKRTETILNDLVGQIVKHLKKGDRIRIGGLGILQVRKRAAHMGRNPATGDHIKIKASKKVAFRAAKELKDAV